MWSWACIRPIAVAPMLDWLTFLTFTQIYVDGAEVAQLGQVWSLATEAAFYGVLPILAWWAGRRHRGASRPQCP